MEATVAKPEVFSRKASGLSRVMSPWSAFMYNFLTMGVIFPWIIAEAPYAFPGVSVWLACLFATLLELPIALAYCWMATAMPRSGGDYVFQSRILGGAVGFPIVMSGFVIWILQWLSLAGWLFCTLGLSPMLMGLGVHYQNQHLVSAAVWAQSKEGLIVVSIIGMAAMAMLLVTGFKNYVRLQYFMFAGTGILIAIVLIQFLRTSPSSFAVAMNHYSAFVDKNPNYYNWIQHDVSAAGFNLHAKFALGATLLAAPIAWTSTQWATYSVEQGGEIKGARVFKNQIFIIVGSLIALGCVLALIAAAEQKAVGTGFFHAVSASWFGGVSKSGNGIGSVFPFPGTYATVISPNPILVIVTGVCFMLASLQITCNCYIGVTRIMVGMSLDRTLPAWLSRISPRFRSPLNAHLIYFICGVVWLFGYTMISSWAKLTLGVTFAAGYVFVVSALAAALLPYRAKALFDAAPGAQYKIFGIPWVTVLGLIGFVLGVIASALFLIKPAYGLKNTVGYVIVAGVFVACLVVFWITRYYQRGRGVDISYAFLEVPPE